MKFLTELANKYGTDKGTLIAPAHGFTEIYHKYFESSREKVVKVLEIGVERGYSLQMWSEFFPNALIVGMDVHINVISQNPNIAIEYGNQAVEQDLLNVVSKYGDNFDIIIDDGGHDIVLQQSTFGTLFKYVKPGGHYIVEDLHSSFIPHYLASHNMREGDDATAYNVFTRLQQTNALTTPYIHKTDIEYIQDNLDCIEIYDLQNDRNHITSIIKKKCL